MPATHLLMSIAACGACGTEMILEYIPAKKQYFYPHPFVVNDAPLHCPYAGKKIAPAMLPLVVIEDEDL